MASLTDVAQRAKVSIATVSRTISHADKVAPKTRELVQKAMEELGYKPNRVARRLRQKRGRRHLLGLIIPNIQNPFFAEIARGVEDAAYSHQFAVMLCNSDEDLKKEEFYLDVLCSESVDGIILPPIFENDPVVERVISAGVPIVCVDRNISDSAMDAVDTDNRLGARMAVEHLLKIGHTRVAIIAGLPSVSTSRDRRMGYVDALRARNLPIRDDYIHVGDYLQGSGATLAGNLLRLDEPPTAIFAHNNLMALGALEGIHRRGLKVPDDVAIIGFDDLPWAEALDPPLSVVRQPAYEMGRVAVDLLLKRLTDPHAPVNRLRLEPELVLRKSC